MKKFASLFCLAAIILCLPARAALAGEEYNFQSHWNSAHQLNKTMLEPWCKEITEKSKGELVLHYAALNTLAKVDAVPGAINKGVLESGGIQMQTAIAMMPLSQLLSKAFLVRDAKEAEELYNKMYESFPEMKAEIDNNYHLLGMLGSDRYCFASTNGLIKSPADLKGKRVLVWAPVQIDEVKSWGGIPTQVASSETYMGLQRGLGEVAYVPVPAYKSTKLNEVAKYCTVISSRSLPMIMVMNKEAWAALSPETQKLITDTTGRTMTKKLAEGLVVITDSDMEAAKKDGVAVHYLSPEEEKAFAATFADIENTYWKDILGRNNVKNPEEWLQKVNKLAAETLKR